MSYRLSWEATC